MGNIEKKKEEELSYNAQRIVGAVGRGIDGRPLPLHCWHIDPSVEEMCEAMKYIIDTGWLCWSDHLMRKCEYEENGVIKPAVAFVDNAADFDYDELHGYYSYPSEYPTVIGKSNCHTFKTESGFIDHTYDGDVFLQLNDGSMVSYDEWKRLQK